MSATSLSRMVLLVAGCALALVLAFHQYGTSPVGTQAATATPPGSAPASGGQDRGLAEVGQPQAQVKALVGALTGSVGPADNGDRLPAFDIARIEPKGEAVIAGRAAPGATVELLLNGDVHDRAIADQSGQFVMIPPPLPPGAYDLTLRSKQLDDKQATSEQSVAVAIEPSLTNRPLVVTIAPGKPTGVLSRPDPSTAGAAIIESVEIKPGGNLLAAKIAMRTVSRGDSLWRLSRLSYGAGTRYALIYKANRDQIRNPNLIHPGQTFVLPARQ
jgi:nucleoid-associated protein YgaU